MSSNSTSAKLGEHVFSKADKINSEVFTLAYGAIVMQMLRDFEDVNEVNKQLERMGYNIGIRLIDEFLARTGVGRCRDLKETAELISKVGFKLFLGVTCSVSNWSADEKSFSLLLEDNPLTEFVELPSKPVIPGSAPPSQALLYSNVLCGVIRGALEMVQLSVECKFARDTLRGDDVTEIRVDFKEYLADEVPVGDE